MTSNEHTVVRLADQLIAEAIAARASDIHLEPGAGDCRVRLRIDGTLRETERLPREWQRPLVARFKLLAGLSLAEKRLPQDGRFRFTPASGGRAVDVRAASLPAVHGESLVLRLLDGAQLPRDLTALGLSEPHRARLGHVIRRPDGLVLVTGPTGSGKTTTLYACLQQLNTPDRKLLTVEDPVEYRIAGINQVSVDEATGLTFATALRAMLRQAPNVILVGEIRDRETAEIALHAALTGHLVLSTLHTMDAAGAVVRLLDLGAKPFLVAAALRAVLAQRLVRRVCPQCRVGAAFRDAVTGDRGAPRETPPPACPQCRGAGFHGRIGCFEWLEVDPELAALVQRRAPASEWREAAARRGFSTLADDARAKVAAGWTSAEEAAAVTGGGAAGAFGLSTERENRAFTPVGKGV